MIRYLNRDGVEITPDVWRRLSRSLNYATVQITQGDGLQITTTYVGLVSTEEKVQGLFCTQVRAGHGLAQKQPIAPEVWSESESDALKAHNELCERYLFH